MPRYHFHVHDGVTDLDGEGMELADLKAAKAMASRQASELLRDDSEHLWADGEWQLEVTDDDGLALFTLMFSCRDAPAIKPS